MVDPKFIYLEPYCEECEKGATVSWERYWCKDDIWKGEVCIECGEKLKSTKYVLVDEQAPAED